ncbi:MAG: (2Fe-2S)-binding protein [Archaeoglobus sp.]|nr:(2Fe-2S)-binding protein [Archaeoglobus sp.]
MKMKIEVDGNDYEVDGEKRLLDVLLELGFEIPHLCYHKAIGSYGACRLCLVEIEENGWRIVASCSTQVKDGMKIRTNSDRIQELRRGVIELLANHTSSEIVEKLASSYGLEVKGDKKCVLCGLCVNVCSVMGVSAIAFESRGIDRKVNAPFGVPTDFCAGCLACTNVCPTGAIRFENGKLMVGPRVLSEHRFLRCERCGKEVVTERLYGMLSIKEVLCEDCKKRMQAEKFVLGKLY